MGSFHSFNLREVHFIPNLATALGRRFVSSGCWLRSMRRPHPGRAHQCGMSQRCSWERTALLFIRPGSHSQFFTLTVSNVVDSHFFKGMFVASCRSSSRATCPLITKYASPNRRNSCVNYPRLKAGACVWTPPQLGIPGEACRFGFSIRHKRRVLTRRPSLPSLAGQGAFAS
jgi:hypothetical protein